MGVRIKTIEGFFEIPSGSGNFEWVDIKVDSIGCMNLNSHGGMIDFKVFRGDWRRKFKNIMKEQGLEPLSVPREHLYFWPAGLEDGVLNPAKTQIVFGNAHMVATKKVKEIKEALEGKDKNWIIAQKYKKERNEMEKKLELMRDKTSQGGDSESYKKMIETMMSEMKDLKQKNERLETESMTYKGQ